MEEVQELQLHITDTQEQNSPTNCNATQIPEEAPITKQLLPLRRKRYIWWLLVALYSLLILIGQSVGTLLGRFYFDNGGNSKWLATFVQSAGFPILIPFVLFFSLHPSSDNTTSTSPSILTLTFLYVSLGLLVSGDNLMYSYGLLNLPVSTYSLICATQLAFNALFSFFLNSLKFTPFILNSLVLVTISASILAVHTDSAGPSSSTSEGKGNYTIGFLCTIGASATFSLVLSLTQLCFEKVLKRETFSVILEMQIFPAMVATCVCVVGLFASGEWKGLKGEMEGFTSGKVSYLMTLIWTALMWQVFSLGSLGLIFEASSLFCNVISAVSLPIIPVLAVIIFHDKMDGVKVVAMLLAIWGFASYVYQHYLDDSKLKKTVRTNVNEISMGSAS